jgi:hypothetical protein
MLIYVGMTPASNRSNDIQPISARLVAGLHIRHLSDIRHRYRADITTDIGLILDLYKMFAGV